MSLEIRLPYLGEGIREAEVTRVHVAPGDRVGKDQPILDAESEKAAFEIPAAAAGTVEAVHVAPGERVEIGRLLVTLRGEGAAATAPVEAPAATPTPRPVEAPSPLPAEAVAGVAAVPPASAPSVDHRPILAAPSVRRLAREFGIDLLGVTGTGPRGRILPEDVKRRSRERNRTPAAGAEAPPPFPDLSRWGEIEEKPLSTLRRAAAAHLSVAWRTVPHVTQFDKADITVLERLRKQFEEKVRQTGGKLTVTAILLKVAATALKTFPKFNASIDVENRRVVYKRYCHIGVAVDTEAGLVVPVVRDVDRKNILEIAVELTALSDRARARKLLPEEMRGGCFTVSNLGGIGGGHFTPIIHWPEVAILGVGRAAAEPVPVGDRFEPRTILPLSLSYDHRWIDGADGARFLRWIAEALGQPFLLSLEG